MDKSELLEKVAGCLHYNDHKSIFSWLERARKAASQADYDDILLEAFILIERSDSTTAKRIAIEGLSAEVARIRAQRTEVELEQNRLKAVAEEERKRAAAEKKLKEEEERIEEAIAYLESIRASYLEIKREDLPVFARTRKIELLKEAKAAEAKAAKERFEEEKFQRLQEVHISFLSKKGIDTETRILISLVGTNRRRITHCYSCKGHLDEALHLNCSECRWIVCPSCGACGCGYTKA